MARSDPISFTNYAVSFHDVLDQGSALMQWDNLDQLDQPGSEAHEALLKTVITVKQIRTEFNGFLSGFNRRTKLSAEDEEIRERYPKLAEQMDRVRAGQIQSQAFSDTNIWFTPLRDTHGTMFTRTASHLVSGTAFTHLLALSNSVACRGAINLGAGTNAFEGEIYGPALLKAYLLESKAAAYPRVVVGDDFMSYFGSLTDDLFRIEDDEESSRLFALYHKRWAQLIKDYTFMDDDGLICLDFAGPTASQEYSPHLSNAGMDPHDVFSTAFTFVERSLEIFLKARNHHLAGRYVRLWNYLSARRDLWTKS